MEWVKCSDRMPDNNQRVIVWNRTRNKWYEDVCIISKNIQPHWYNSPLHAITYWCLPEPPKNMNICATCEGTGEIEKTENLIVKPPKQ